VILAAAGAWMIETGGPFEQGRCRVVWVTDGDTVRAFCPGRPGGAVRLTGVDTPETFSPGCLGEWLKGMQATGWLIWGVATSEARLTLSGRDRYGRHLGRLTLDGRDAGDWLISRGLARAYDGGRRAGWCG
jgi:endonuclease YncB( thermonuclease family)